MQRSESIFIQLLLVYSAGLIFGYSFPSLCLQHWVATAGLFLLIILWLLNLLYRSWGLYRFKSTLFFLFFLLFLCAGCWRCLEQKQDLQHNHFSRPQAKYLKIKIDDEPQQGSGSAHFKARVVSAYSDGNTLPCSGRLLVYVKTSHLNLIYGDELMVSAKFIPVAPPVNSYNFDFRAWLANQNIYHQCFLKETQFVLLRHDQGNPLIAYALRLRQRQIDIYRSLLKNDEAFAVASTLILGYRADLSSETLDAYAKTGTIHALSVSGMHVGIIYVVLNWLLTFCNRNGLLKAFKTLLILVLIWFYALLTGFSPSVLRSAIMLSVYIVSKATGRQTNSYNILAFSAFCLLLYDPFLLFDVGFQLSYLSVFGLIYIHPLIFGWFSFKFKWFTRLWGILALSLAAQIATFPLSIYYFHQFPMYFLFSNLFIMLPAAVMMYLGLSILLFKLHFLAPFFEWTISFTNAGLKWISGLPSAIVPQIWISRTELLILSTALILGIVALKYHHKKLICMSLLLFLLLETMLTRDKFIAHRQREFVVFKLPKNYAAAFLTGSKAIVSTDVAADSKTFKYSVKPYLDAHRIRNIYFTNTPYTTLQSIQK